MASFAVIKRQLVGKQRWQFLPLFLVLIIVVSLGLIAYLSLERIQMVAQQLAAEDAAVVRWWYRDYKARYSEQISMLAEDLSAPADLEAMAVETGLGEEARLVWIGPDGEVVAGVNTAALPDDLLDAKLDDFVQAMKTATAELWRADDTLSLVSMAPVSEENGGGLLIMQTPFGAEQIQALADLVGRDILFVSFEGQERLLSSDPDLRTALPLPPAAFLREVATSQTPGSLRIAGEGASYILGVTALADFAGMDFIGYFILAEQAQSVSNHLPLATATVVIVFAILFAMVGAYLLLRRTRRYLRRYRELSLAAQRAWKLKTAGLLALFVLPALLSGGYLLVTTGNRSRSFDERSTQIAAAALADALAARSVESEALPALLENIGDAFPAGISLFANAQPIFTTLSEREIADISFDRSVEEALRQNGEAFFSQKIGWIVSKVYTRSLGDEAQWRLLVSQPSTIWQNSITSYNAIVVAILVVMVLTVALLAGTTLYQDKRVLLHKLFTGYFFILPALIWLVWWLLGPALFAGYLSFHKWSVLSPEKPFVGLHNFRLILDDEKFWNAMGNTVIYLIQIPIGMAISLGLALVLNRKMQGIRFLRTIYYMPAVTSIVVVSLMWQWIYNKDFGILNYFLGFFNLGPYGWLNSTAMALPSIMLMAVWLGLGARMILFLAGLQSIPSEYYEAADVDGANNWSKFWHITFPLLMPTTFFVLVTSIIGSFQVFTPVYVLTGGGPAGSTDVAVHRIYFEAWQNLRFGYASAETLILFICLFVLTLIQFRYFGRRVQYV